MNSLTGREWEIYNLDQIGASTEYDNILINKDIDNYFNDLLSKPVPMQNNLISKSNYNFDKFYSDYIEHNLLFIVVLVGIIIFLIIRHYIKDFDSFSSESLNSNDNSLKKNNKDMNVNVNMKVNEDSDEDVNKEDVYNEDVNEEDVNIIQIKKNKLRKLNQIKKKQQNEKIKLFNYKKQLDNEKEKILSIIDELSNINEYENLRSQPYPKYLGQNINTHYNNEPDYLDSHKFFNQQIDNFPKLPHNMNDSSHYYDINKNQDDETNKIDGLYIEPPFN